MHTAVQHPPLSVVARAVRPAWTLQTTGQAPDTGRPTFALLRGGQQRGLIRYRAFAGREGWQYVPAGTAARSRSRTLWTHLPACLRHAAGLTAIESTDAIRSNADAFAEVGDEPADEVAA